MLEKMTKPIFECSISGRPIVKKNTRIKYSVYSKKFKAWESWALSQLNVSRLCKIEAPIDMNLEMEITFRLKNRQSEPDLSNLIEGPQDALQKSGIIKNDKQICLIQARKIFGCAAESTEIKLYPLADEAPDILAKAETGKKMRLRYTELINTPNLSTAMNKFFDAKPFDHCVIDDFFTTRATGLINEFPNEEWPNWHVYSNAIENKKTLNDWNRFPEKTYEVFSILNSNAFVSYLSMMVGMKLFADPGLHGGGWHFHGPGGNLNPHLDYSIHPKLGLQRKLNLIVYLSNCDYRTGGHLGLWSGKERPKKLEVEIEPRINRAVIFDTTQNSWHGMSRKMSAAPGVYRKSIAVYYLCEPDKDADQRKRALFAPRDYQDNDPEVKELIRKRADPNTSGEVYRK